MSTVYSNKNVGEGKELRIRVAVISSESNAPTRHKMHTAEIGVAKQKKRHGGLFNDCQICFRNAQFGLCRGKRSETRIFHDWGMEFVCEAIDNL